MGATIFLMMVLLIGTAVTAVVFGIQVLVDHSQSKITAWSKKAAVISIILGVITFVTIGIMIVGAFI